MIKIPIDKQFKKELNDINQELKQIYSSYYIMPNGFIYGNVSGSKIIGETHYAKINRDFIDGIIMEITSESIYKLYTTKGMKATISNLVLDDENNKIYIECIKDNIVTPVIIGEYFNKDSIGIISTLKTKEFDMNLIINFQTMKFIDEEVCDGLKTNEVYDIEYLDRYYIKLARNIIPGVKKTHTAEIQFIETSENISDVSYTTIIKVNRGIVTTYHIYHCIYL